MKLFEKLNAIKNEQLVSFHVPGHKYSSYYEAYFNQLNSILDIDVTEIPGSDDLFDATTCILESQQAVSKQLGTISSHFLVGGTTAGIYAMIMTATNPGDQVIVARDCHRAVYDALLLGRLQGVFVMPKIYQDISLGLTPEHVEKALELNPKAKAVILTYPNYYGVGTDLKAIRKITEDRGVLLLVDEAHGAHLFLGEAMPSAVDIGADMVVHSSHKSLPVMTQASVLHLNSDNIDEKKLAYMLKLHQTSSPSYVLMSSLDIGYDIAFKHGKKLMVDLVEQIEKLKEKHPYFLTQSDLPNGFSLDRTKLTYLGKKANVDPKNFDNELRKNGIQLEFSTDKYAVFVTSIMNKQRDFDKLSKTMEMLKFKCYSGIDSIDYFRNKVMISDISKAYYGNKKKIKLKDAVGKKSADYIIPYPPGIPMIIPGEIIEKQSIVKIEEMLAKDINFQGVKSLEDDIEVLADEEA